MSFNWLKKYMPRGLYGRAALILVLPVVTLQLLVLVVFIQRHFEGVTEQLSRELARSVNLAIERLPETHLQRALEVPLRVVPEESLPPADFRRWYDLSGIVVIRELSRRVDGVARISLPDNGQVILYIRRHGRLYESALARERASASNPHQLLVNMAVFGGLMTVIAFLYLRNQLRPITRLAHAAQAFGRGHNLPYAPSGALEVRAAGQAFLDMRNRIERHIEQRTMMLSGVSHDLRTPLTRLRLGLSLLDEDDRIPLERDVIEMQHLIDAFLDFTRSDAEAAGAEETNPSHLLEDIVADARRGGQDVTLYLPSEQHSMTLRPRALRRAVENLLTNAARYGSKAHVTLRFGEKSLRIRIEDDGPGIPPESREEAMRPFVRLDPARNQDRGSGVGLGLAIAADIARAHGGLLRLSQSDALGGLRADIVIAL